MSLGPTQPQPKHDGDVEVSSAPSWHHKSADEVVRLLDTNRQGLSHEAVTQRRTQYGQNRFTQKRTLTLAERIFKQLMSPLALVLVIAFFVTLALAEFVDAGVIALALLIAVVVGVLQEGKASRAFEKLSNSQVKRATVIRDGHRTEVDAWELVPGDVVELLNGAQVPADIRLLQAKKLSINEAALTGEWLAVKKQLAPVAIGAPLAERSNMAWMGTFVAEGHGIGVVVATGDQTAVGTLAQDVQAVEETTTPLQAEMAQISNVMLYIITGIVFLIFLLGLWQGQSLQEMLLLSIAVAVASVPEGLPAAVTIILAIGMEALLKRGGLVRNLLAAETLGSTTYVLTDKTGTLTQAKMAVTDVLFANGPMANGDNWRDDPAVRFLANISLCASDAYYDVEAKVMRGDPVERAINELAAAVDITENERSYRAERFDYLAFTSEHRYAAGLSSWDGKHTLCINGAPGLLLERSSHYYDGGAVRELTPEIRTQFTDHIETETAQGKRLVAVAYQEVGYDDIPEENGDVIEGSVFLGVLVFTDPVRKGVGQAITGVRNAGARVLLVTGDNPQTALSIAAEVGIARADEQVLTGSDLEQLSDEELLTALENISVLARVLPKQKMRIAQVLQQRGEIVAMTGDGINDAPALQRAHIGVAIGSGTEVAKESSDLVLVKDSFATIYAAIEEGRRIISNLRKIVGYLLSTSLSEVVLIGAATIIGAPAPILAPQILWANVIEEGLMSVAFAFEKGEKGAMKRKPQDIHSEGILSVDMRWFMVFVITVLSMLSVGLYFYLRWLELPLETLRSAMFLSIALDSLFMAFAFRSLNVPIWRIPLNENIFFIGAFALSATLFVIAITVPFLRDVLSYEPLTAPLFALVIGFSLASLAIIEIGKALFLEERAK